MKTRAAAMAMVSFTRTSRKMGATPALRLAGVADAVLRQELVLPSKRLNDEPLRLLFGLSSVWSEVFTKFTSVRPP